jgi:hypothetical protein
MKRIFFQRSESCRNLTQDEIGVILHILWEHDKTLKIALLWREATWSIRLETQRYIDNMSHIHGTSVSFPLVTPRVTMLSLEEWTERPEPRQAFSSQVTFRRFLILREYHRVFRIPNTIFMSSTEFSMNNHLIQGASNSEWLVKGYNSSSRTKWEYCQNPPTGLSPPPSHLSRGM